MLSIRWPSYKKNVSDLTLKRAATSFLHCFITFSHDEGWNTSCSNGRDKGVTLLGNAHLPVPTAVSLSWGKHVSTTAHVTKGSL